MTRNKLDATAFVHRLLLFDEYILESHLLEEFHDLVSAFGTRAVQEALDCGALRVRSQALTIGQIAQYDPLGTGRARKFLTFKFATVADADFETSFRDNLQIIGTIPELRFKEAKALKKLIADRRIQPDTNTTREAILRLGRDLDSNSPHIISGIRVAAQTLFGKTLPQDVTIKFVRDGDFYTCESNIPSLLELSPLEHHHLIEHGLLMCAGLEQRFQDLQRYQAVFGIRPEETAILDDRMRALWDIVMPASPERQMSRIVTLQGLPHIDAAASAGQADLRKVLEIRQSEECLAFRQWLRDSSHLSDDDLHEVLNSIRGRIAVATHGTLGKAIRLTVSTFVGAIPGIGPLLGLALGAADTFLLEKVLRKNAVLHFIRVQYPSLFHGLKAPILESDGQSAPAALSEAD